MPTEPMPSTEARRAYILVIDDEPLVAAVVADTLMVIGCEVEALRMAGRPWRRSRPAHTISS